MSNTNESEVSLKLDGSLFEGHFDVDMDYFGGVAYTNNLDDLNWLDRIDDIVDDYDDADDIIEAIKEIISELKSIFVKNNNNYENIKNNLNEDMMMYVKNEYYENIEGEVRLDKEYESQKQHLLDTSLSDLEYIHKTVVDDLKKRISDSKYALENITNIFIFEYQ